MLERAHGRAGARARHPVDRPGVESAGPQRNLERGHVAAARGRRCRDDQPEQHRDHGEVGKARHVTAPSPRPAAANQLGETLLAYGVKRTVITSPSATL
jgi:hypothetical protein